MKVDVNDLIRRLGNGDASKFALMDSVNEPTHHTVLQARDLLVMWTGVIRSTQSLYGLCEGIINGDEFLLDSTKLREIMKHVQKVSGLADGYLDNTKEEIDKEIERLQMLKEELAEKEATK